ncbi:TniB family NTP-binding protein [Methylobacillus sp.]|uniref:TniB family NTP-binding protein n=1 Tax=Methylobacillus sp. TaxID=56818 RepID=UPI002FE1777B
MQNATLFDAVELRPSVQVIPASLSRLQALDGTPAQKADFVRQVKVNVEGFNQARKFIDALLARAKHTRKPGGLWILGSGGVGKSFILDDIYHRYPPKETQSTRHTPVLSLSFEGTPVWSTILLSLILQLGQDPDLLHYRKNDDLRDYLVDALPECGTVAIMFDEAQHLWLNTKAKRVQDRMGGALGDAIKRLYDDLQVAFIFTGTPGLIKVYEDDAQAKTRWSGLLQLQEFVFDNRFIGLLKALEEAIPLEGQSQLTDENTAFKLYQASKGNFRLLKDLLAEAVFLAANSNSLSISTRHLANAFFNRFCAVENPFL